MSGKPARGTHLSSVEVHGLPSTPEDVPGKATSMATAAAEGAASALQSFKPLGNFGQHICTWAMYSQDPSRKIQTHHFASRLSEDVVQCIVFDSPEKNARIIGVEYIISEHQFELLPDEEKKLWHSHAYEVVEGLWLYPGVPKTMQRSEVKSLIHTYGKFWNTWQFDRGDKLPLGPPALMVSPQDHPISRISPEMIKARDEQMKTDTRENQEARSSLRKQLKKKVTKEEVARCADWWMRSGEGWMIELKPTPLNMEAKGEGAIRTLEGATEGAPGG